MIRRTLVLSLALLSVASCAARNDGGPAPDGPRRSLGEDSFIPPSRGADKSIAVPSTRSVTGVLTFADVEGGCWLVTAADGSQFEVLYPAGWSINRDAGRLEGPDGIVVNHGEAVTVEGSLATDRSSICQVGHIFQATRVIVPAG